MPQVQPKSRRPVRDPCELIKSITPHLPEVRRRTTCLDHGRCAHRGQTQPVRAPTERGTGRIRRPPEARVRDAQAKTLDKACFRSNRAADASPAHVSIQQGGKACSAPATPNDDSSEDSITGRIAKPPRHGGCRAPDPGKERRCSARNLRGALIGANSDSTKEHRRSRRR